jgi:hypothetical protein
MKRTGIIMLVAMFALSAFAVAAADLTIDMQVNTVAKDYANNYLTFKGLINSVEKDQFAGAVDATSGASKLLSTEVFNAYRLDAKGMATMPMALRHVMLYAVAIDTIRAGDNLKVTKGSNGALTIRFVHRGTAYEIVTEAGGKLTLPTTTAVRMRAIGATDGTIHTDFSRSGKVADVDWAKVWNARIADGKTIGTTTSKTGKIVQDVATSDMFAWSGTYQFTFDGKLLKLTASLDAVKK